MFKEVGMKTSPKSPRNRDSSRPFTAPRERADTTTRQLRRSKKHRALPRVSKLGWCCAVSPCLFQGLIIGRTCWLRWWGWD